MIVFKSLLTICVQLSNLEYIPLKQKKQVLLIVDNFLSQKCHVETVLEDQHFLTALEKSLYESHTPSRSMQHLGLEVHSK